MSPTPSAMRSGVITATTTHKRKNPPEVAPSERVRKAPERFSTVKHDWPSPARQEVLALRRTHHG